MGILTIPRKQADQLFYQTWYGFQANLGSLRLFSEEISKKANEFDQDRIQELAKNLSDIFGDDPAQIEAEIVEFTPSLDGRDVLPDIRKNTQVRETFEAFKDSEFKSRVLSWSRENPRKSYKLANIFWEYFAYPPLSGILLRRGSFVSLIGFLEQLLENLFYCYCYLNDSDDGADEKAREARARKKAKKMNSPDDGWRGRFREIRKLEVVTDTVECYFGELIEITQRRNLFVHKDGVIDKAYMDNVSKEFIPNEADLGKILLVPSEYLEHVFDVVTAFSFALIQMCWRKWLPDGNTKQVDKSCDLFIYTELKKKRYSLVVELAGAVKQFQFPDSYRQMILINQAIAFRQLGRFLEMGDVLSELSRMRRKWWAVMAQAIFREDYQQTHLLLTRASKKNVLKDVTPFWPLFEPIEKELWFQDLFERPNHGELPVNKNKH